MHRSWRLAVYAVITSLLTVGGVTAGMSVAHANGSVSCTGSGANATCTVSATISQPTSVSVTARATLNGDATFTWSANCTASGQSKTGSGGETAETPATDTVTLPIASPESCAVSATVTLPTTDATNTLDVDLVFTGTASASPSPSASSSAPPPATVRGYKGYGGKCVDDAGNGSADRTKIQIWTCNSHDQAQGWSFSGGKLVHNGKCANDQRFGGNGSKVILYACNGAANEIWTHLANGEFVLKANGGKYCLDDPAFSTTNGTQLIVWTCKDSANQRWFQIVGGRAVMAEQIDQLITATGGPSTVVQVLTFADGEGVGADGPISVYEFPEAASVCYTECNRGGRLIEDHAEVAEMMTKVNMIRVSALSPRASVELMREIRSRLDDQQ